MTRVKTGDKSITDFKHACSTCFIEQLYGIESFYKAILTWLVSLYHISTASYYNKIKHHVRIYSVSDFLGNSYSVTFFIYTTGTTRHYV